MCYYSLVDIMATAITNRIIILLPIIQNERVTLEMIVFLHGCFQN